MSNPAFKSKRLFFNKQKGILEWRVFMEIGNTRNTDNINIFVGKEQSPFFSRNRGAEKKEQIKNGTLFAGDLNGAQDNIITKRALASREALKTILDQFARDNKTSDGMDEIRGRQEELAKQMEDATSKIEEINENKQLLMESYGIDENSEEHKNLKLLEKSMDFGEVLSEEEQETLANMGPLTDYQKEALKQDEMINAWEDVRQAAKLGYQNAGNTIVDIKLELLKQKPPMLKAQEEAAKIMEDARKEVIGMLRKEAVDNVEERAEEEKEKEEKLKETEKEKEEKTAKSEKTEQQKQADRIEEEQNDIVQAYDTQDKLEKELQEIVQINEVLEEDLKGIKIDATI